MDCRVTALTRRPGNDTAVVVMTQNKWEKLWLQYCPSSGRPKLYWPFIDMTASKFRLMW